MSTTSTIGTSSRNYSTIAAWHAAFATGGWIGECYNDTEFVITSDTVVGGTSLTDYEILRCAAGQSAWDTSNPLLYDQSKGVGIRVATSYVTPLKTTSGFVTFERLQMRLESAGNAQGCIDISFGAGACTINRCLLQEEQTPDSNRGPLTIPGSVLVTNTVLISFNNSAVHIVYGNGSKFVNVTAVAPSDKSNGNLAFASKGGSDNAPVFKNVACFGFSGGFTDLSNSTGSNNATDLSSFGFTSSSSLTSKTFSSQFTGIASSGMDYRLKAGSDLIDAGVTDSTDIPAANDIFGTSRPQGSAWDIGAHEFSSGGGDVTVALTGSAATAAAGSLGKGSLITRALTGIAATAATGTISAGADKTIALTGISAAAAAGSIAASMSKGLTGAAATSAAGNLSKASLVTIGLTGTALATATGTISIPGDKTVALTGQSMTALAGNITASVPLLDAGLPLSHREAERIREQARKREEQIEAAWERRKAERQELQDQLWRAARKGKFDGADRPEVAITPVGDNEDEDIEFLLLYA